MADELNPKVKVGTEVDQKPLDSGLKQVHDKVEHTSKEGSEMFKKMFEALSLEKVVEKGLEVVTDFFKESIEGAKEAELNVNQLKNALDNAGDSKSFDAIIESSEELSKKFVISKQDIIKSQTALETYGKLTQKQIKDLEPVILNYSKKTGKSVQESTDDIIRGLEGQGKGLKTLGVTLKIGGTVAENFGDIMDQVGSKVNGAADTFNKTAAGGMAKFHLSIEELQERVGKDLLPAIADLTSSFTPLIEQIGPLVEELMPTLTTLLKALAPLFTSLGEIIIKVMKPLGEIINVVVSAFSDLMPELTPILDIFGDIASTILDAFIPPIKLVVGIVSSLIKEILPGLKKELQIVADVFNVVGRVTKIVYTIFQKLVDKLKDMFSSSKQAGEGMQIFNKIITAVTGAIKTAFEWISKLLDKVEAFLGIDDKTTKKSIEETTGALKEQGDVAEDIDKKKQIIDKNQQKRNDKAAKDAKKAADDLNKLNDKYFEDKRAKLAQSFDDDAKGLKKDSALYKQILVKKQEALDAFDQEEATKAAKKAEEERKKYDKEKEQLQKNLEEQTEILKTYHKTNDQVDEKYNELKTKNASFTDEEIYKLIKEEYQKEVDLRDKKVKDELDANQNKIDALQTQELGLNKDQINAKEALEKQILDIQADSLDKQYAADIIAAQDDKKAIAKIDAKYRKDKATADKAARDKKIADDKTAQEAEISIATDGLNSISALNDLAFSIKDANLKKGSKAAEEAAKKEFEINKSVQMASAIISGITGVMRALDAETVIPDPLGSALKVANAVAVGAAAAANIAKIAATQYTSSSSGSSPATPTSNQTAPSANQTVGLNTQSTQLYNGNQQYQSNQVMVVANSDINKVNNRVQVVANRSQL